MIKLRFLLKTSKFLPSIRNSYIISWNKNLVKNNPKIAAVEGLSTDANIIVGCIYNIINFILQKMK
jgi:hypothetical protein